MIKRAGKVWKRVRASLKGKRDEEEFRECQEELAEHVRAATRGEIDIFFLDESGVGRTPYIPYAWQDNGDTLLLPCRK